MDPRSIQTNFCLPPSLIVFWFIEDEKAVILSSIWFFVLIPINKKNCTSNSSTFSIYLHQIEIPLILKLGSIALLINICIYLWILLQYEFQYLDLKIFPSLSRFVPNFNVAVGYDVRTKIWSHPELRIQSDVHRLIERKMR